MHKSSPRQACLSRCGEYLPGRHAAPPGRDGPLVHAAQPGRDGPLVHAAPPGRDGRPVHAAPPGRDGRPAAPFGRDDHSSHAATLGGDGHPVHAAPSSGHPVHAAPSGGHPVHAAPPGGDSRPVHAALAGRGGRTVRAPGLAVGLRALPYRDMGQTTVPVVVIVPARPAGAAPVARCCRGAGRHHPPGRLVRMARVRAHRPKSWSS
jgi:hypothetical protein